MTQQVTEAHKVLDSATRASQRQRHAARTWIKHARREGRITQETCDARLAAAAEAVTTADLTHLTKDLGTREGPHPVRTTAALYVSIIILAVWPPVIVSGLWWLILAVPVTAVSAYGIWVLPDYIS